MLKLYNKEHVAVSALTNLKDYKIEYLLSGEDSLEFSLSIADEDIHLVEEEGYVRNKFNEYVIKAIDPSQGFKRFSCVANVESIKGKSIANFDTSNNNITDTIRLAIAGTGWILADNNITKRRTVRLKNTNALEVLREVRKVFRVDFRFDAINKIIHVYEEFGEDKGVYFSDELNLRSLDIPSDTYDYVTRLYCYGKDGLNISSINSGKEYIENFQYSKKIIELIWEDNRYTDVNSLKADAEAKLDELSKPKRSYQASISDLAKQSDKYSFLDFFLGDTITLLSKQEKFRDKQRIVKYIQYPNNPSQNTCELGNTQLTFEDLQKENESKNNIVDNITSDNGTVDGSKVDSITTEQISDFEAEVAKITDLTVVNAEITNLKAQNVTITGKLTAIEGEFGTIKANVATIDSLTVTHTAQINDLKANSATITQLEAVSAKIGTVEAEVGKIQTLVNGNLTSDNIHSLILTSGKVTVENGFIKNAMIENVDVSKVNAGDISTNKFRIKSDDGGIEIVGATQQFKDKNNKVRIQMGKDSKGNFNFIIRGEDGTTTLIDHTGIKQGAIANDLIVSNMIASDAVGEKQINYSSFITGFNKDTNTSTIKSTKIMLNNQNQTLEVAFNSLKIQADGTKSLTESHSTNIGVMQSQITGLISDTTIVEDGTSKKIKDAYTSLKATVNGISSKVSSVESSFNNLQIGGRNLIIQNNLTNGWVQSNGIVANSNIYKVTEYIPCSEGETFIFQMWMPNSVQVWYDDSYFDANKVYIDSYNSNYITNTYFYKVFVAPTNAKYIRVSFTYNENYKYKLERGTKPTDYTPAQEDIDSSINAVDTKVTALDVTVKSTSSKVSAIEQSMESITQRVSSTETKVTTITNTANTAKTQADKAIADAKTASDKATSAQSTANSANSKIDGLEIGGRNLILNSTLLNNSEKWYFSNYSNINRFVDGNFTGIKLNTNGGYTATAETKIKAGKTYTISYFRKNTSACNMWIGFYFSDNTYISAPGYINHICKDWKRYTNTFTVPEGKSGINLRIYSYTAGVDLYIRNIKVCEGESLIYDWTPAPEDTQSQIDANKTEITTTKNKVSTIETNLSSITSRVSTVESKQTTVDGKVTALETWKKSAEQKITDSAIISTVSSQFYNKGQTDSKYASKSTITQLEDKVKYQFETSGSINYVKNSDFGKDMLHWKLENYEGGGFEFPKDLSCPTGKGISIVGQLNKTKSALQWVEVPGNADTYNISCYMYKTDGGWGPNGKVDLHVKVVYNDGTNDYIDMHSKTLNSWERIGYVYTKRQGKKISRFEVFLYCKDTTVKVYCSGIMIAEGGTIVAWRPNPHEIYTNITTIDGNGVTVSHEDGSSATMTNNSVDFADTNGSKKMSVKRGGLWTYDWVSDALWGYLASTRIGVAKGNSLTTSRYNCHYLNFGENSFAYDTDTVNEGLMYMCMVTNGFESGQEYSKVKGTHFLSYSPYFWVRTHMRSQLYFGNEGSIFIEDDQKGHSIFNENWTLCQYGDDGINLGIKYGTTNKNAFQIKEHEGSANKTWIDNYSNWDFWNYSLYNANIVRSLKAQSPELRSKTKDINNIYSISSTSIDEIRHTGEDTISNGKCIVELPQILSENIQQNYHINICKFGFGDYRISERNEYYFVIEATNDFKFSYEIICNKKDIDMKNSCISTLGLSGPEEPIATDIKVSSFTEDSYNKFTEARD